MDMCSSCILFWKMKPLPVLYLKAFVVQVLCLKQRWMGSGLPNTFARIALSVSMYQALNLNNSLRNHVGLEDEFLFQNGKQYGTQPSLQYFPQHCNVVF